MANRRRSPSPTRWLAPSVVLTLVAAGVQACQPSGAPDGQPPGRDVTPVQIPGRKKPPRPPAPRATTCGLLRPDSVRTHWDRQSTVLAHLESVRGVARRVADARATVYARPGLDSLSVDAFAKAPQAIAQVDLEQPHNGVPAGRYCLVLSYAPDAPNTKDVNDPARWQMFLYDQAGEAAGARAWVPFIAREDSTNAPGHSGKAPRPYPPVRFDFVTDATLKPPGRPRDAVAPAAAAAPPETSWLAMAVWGMCGSNGCCHGGIEAIEAY